ncbi:unnamed protein product, partial [Brassica rapa subsp. trilocularis]
MKDKRMYHFGLDQQCRFPWPNIIKLAVSKICEETPSKFKCLSVNVDGRNMMIFFFFFF